MVMQVSANEQRRAEVSGRPVLTVLSLLIGAGMLVAMVVGMIAGLVEGWKGGVGMLILSAIPVCAVATLLALVALIWRRESKPLAQVSLWINGMLGFFAFPILVFWLIWS